MTSKQAQFQAQYRKLKPLIDFFQMAGLTLPL